jgi:hypothetical protein
MGFASHLGPWQLGTVKNTTGSTSGTVRNMGSTIVSQTKKIDYTGTTVAAPNTTQIAVLPAGAQIININVDTLVAFTGSTAANVVVGYTGTTAAYVASTDITSAGRMANSAFAAKLGNWAGATSTASPNGIGVGTTDVLVNAVLSPTVGTVTAGTVQYTIVYAVANSNGSQTPVSA